MRDPVCGRPLEPDDVKAKFHFQQCDYAFCSEECRRKFEASPRLYLSDSASGA